MTLCVALEMLLNGHCVPEICSVLSSNVSWAPHMVSVTTIQLCLRSLKAAIDNRSMNEHGCVPIKVLFMGTEIGILYSFYVSWSILWIFFSHLINANTILSSWAKWKQELDWIWLADHDLPTSVLDHTGKIWMFEVNFFFLT